MATQPEFITLLRTIRDTYYPQMSMWHVEVQTMYNEIVNMEVDISNMHEDVLAVWNGIITQTASAISVPSANPASATYDASTNNTAFEIPVGEKGDSLDMDYTVATIVERDALTGVTEGDICYVDETLSLYIAMQSGTGSAIWGSAISFSPSTEFIGLGDTPNDYIGQRGKIVTVNSIESGLDFSSHEEIGIEGFNHVYNPRIDNIWSGDTELDNALFGTTREGYAGYDEKAGDSLTTNTIVFAGAGYANNLTVSASGNIAVGVQFSFAALGPSQTLFQIGDELNGFAIGTDGSSQLGLFARNAGVLTSIIVTGLVLTINTEYFIATAEDMVTITNMVTGETHSNTGTLDIPAISYPRFAIGGIGGSFTGTVIGGTATQGANFNGDINAMMVHDRTSYSSVNTDLALGWKKHQGTGDFMVMPVPGDRAGTAIIQYDTSAVGTILDFVIGTAEEFLLGRVTVSFNVSNWSDVPVTLGINYVIDTGNVNNPGGQLIKIPVATPVVAARHIGREEYSFNAPVNPGILLDGNIGYFEVEFDTANPFMFIIDKFKAENGSFDTGYTENHRGPDYVTVEEVIDSLTEEVTATTVRSVAEEKGAGTDRVSGIVSCTQAEYTAIVTPDASTLYLIVG